MYKYQVIYRSPDNSDGIYLGGNLVVSAYRLRMRGYEMERVIHYSQEALRRLVREFSD